MIEVSSHISHILVSPCLLWPCNSLQYKRSYCYYWDGWTSPAAWLQVDAQLGVWDKDSINLRKIWGRRTGSWATRWLVVRALWRATKFLTSALTTVNSHGKREREGDELDLFRIVQGNSTTESTGQSLQGRWGVALPKALTWIPYPRWGTVVDQKGGIIIVIIIDSGIRLKWWTVSYLPAEALFSTWIISIWSTTWKTSKI